jgi:hypothetical protein
MSDPSDLFLPGWDAGYAAGVEDTKIRLQSKITQIEQVLTDLIVELRDIYDHNYGDDTYHPRNDLGIAIGNATLRLREVTGDE